MKSFMQEKLSSITKEDMAVMALGASFFMGVWYAIPMVNTICDVWAFGGGVLRAMEAKTLFPGPDVDYGTISFFQNYLAMIVALGFGLVWSDFDVEALKTLLIINPSYTLIPSRLVSALTAMFLLLVVYRFLKAQVTSAWWRFALLILVFGNVLTALLTRSGKMWILSTLLCVVSFMYLYRALTEERQGGYPKRAALISVVTAFLATANFPFAAVFLINIPILFLFFPKTKQSLQRLLGIVVSGGAVFASVVALNFQNTFVLVSDFITPLLDPSTNSIINNKESLSFAEAFVVNGRHVLEAFPLLILALVVVAVLMVRSRLEDKILAYLSLTYATVYIVMASILFRADHGLALNVRHIFPFAFFLLFCIVAYRAPSRAIAIGFISVGLPVYLYTIILLSVPTTYNAVSDFIVAEYGGTEMRIDEHIFELTLPMNKASYEIFAEEHCGSTCKHRRTLESDIAFVPLIVTDYADTDVVKALPPADIVVREERVVGCTPIAFFGNNVPDTSVFDIDINLGRMLMPSFYKLHQLGKNMYVYQTATCPAAVNVSSLVSNGY